MIVDGATESNMSTIDSILKPNSQLKLQKRFLLNCRTNCLLTKTEKTSVTYKTRFTFVMHNGKEKNALNVFLVIKKERRKEQR